MTKKKKLHGRQKHQSDPLDEIGSDSSAEEPRSTKCCPHVTKAVNLSGLKKAFKGRLNFGVCQSCSKKDCKEPEDLKENEDMCKATWMCLQCAHQGCGRLSNLKHALEHYSKPHSDSHSIVVNTGLWGIWCYQCDDDVDVESSKRLGECVEFIKKQAGVNSNIPAKLNSKTEKNVKYATSEYVQENGDVESLKKEPIVVNEKDEPTTSSIPKKVNGVVYSSSEQIRGLVNLTNTCFFNAVLQNLSQIPCFLHALEEHCKVAGDKEWKFKMPVELDKDINNEFMTLTLPPSESMTITLVNLLREMNSSPQQRKSPNVNPKPLFTLIWQRFSQFRGQFQQDSHEFLRCLLDSVRMEEVKRQKRAILKLFNLTEKTHPDQVEEDVKMKVKALGKNAAHTVIDRVFGGQLVSTVLCEQCQMSSQVFESFMDLSLPICNERPIRPGLHRRSLSEDVADSRNDNGLSCLSKHKEKKIKKQSKKELKKQAKLKQKSSKVVSLSGSTESVFKSEGNEDDVSEADVNDADIEDNEEENPSQESAEIVPISGRTKMESDCQNTSESTSTNDSIVADSDQSTSLSRTLSSSEVTIVGSDIDNGNKEKEMETLCEAVSELVINGGKSESIDSLIESPEDGTLGSPNVGVKDNYLGSTDSGLGHPEKAEEETSENDLKQQWKQMSWKSMAPRYQPSSHECSILSCLNLFTHPEFLMGKNKFGCDNCTRIKADESGVDKDKHPMVYTNATKQIHIFNPPAVLTLHLKRFHQSGMSLTKVNQFVEFSLILDLAPFCSSIALGLPHLRTGQNKILYSLIGVVHHSGTLSGGHYTAYVRKRNGTVPPNLSFLNDKALSQADVDNLLEEFMKKRADRTRVTDKTDPITEMSDEPEINGKWYHISDTHVSQVSESAVLRCQAYLLFYERIV